VVGVTGAGTATEAGHAGAWQTLRDTPTAVRLVLLGVFINQFGAFLQFFLVLYLTQRGFSDGQAGIALGSYSVGAIVGVLFGGAFSDRLGPRWTIVASVGAAALFTLSVTALDDLTAIIAVVALAGAMTQAARPAVSALLFSMTPPARQVMIFAMYRTALNSGVVAGPLVAVWLSTISWNLVFYVDAASALVYAAIAVTVLPRRAATEPAKPADPAGGRAPGYLTILRDYRYLAYLALMLANGLVHVQFFAVLPLMLTADGYGTWPYGAASAMSAFVVISCELLVTRTTQRWPAWIAVISGWILLVIGRGVLGLPGGLVVVFGGSFVAAVGQIIGGPAAFAYPAKVAPAGATGRYIGSAHAMFTLGYAIGPVAGILLWNSIGKAFWGLLFVFGLAMAGAGVWGMRPGSGGSAPSQAPEMPDDATTSDPERADPERASVANPAG
jgi:MFS family permease